MNRFSHSRLKMGYCQLWRCREKTWPIFFTEGKQSDRRKREPDLSQAVEHMSRQPQQHQPDTHN